MFSWFSKRKGNPSSSFVSPVNDFQNSMLSFAEQRLTTWLNTNVGNDWASKVHSYVIEPSRVCAEALPYRVYVYNLEDFMGKFGFEGLARRSDPPGYLFENKKERLDGHTIGVFMYRVQGIPGPPAASSVTQQDEDNEGGAYTTIGLDGDPEQVAEALIRSSLPKTQLDEIDIRDEAGLSRLFACLLLRRHQASLEKDEILRFVDRNRAPLRSGALDLLQKLSEAGTHVEGGEGISQFFDYFATAVSAAIEGRPQDIDIKSDRLLWLLYALGHQLAQGAIGYSPAVSIIRNPQNTNRISPLSLIFMLKDYAESLDTPNQPPIEYLLLILECALISRNVAAVKVTIAILSKSPAPRDSGSFLDLLVRTQEFAKSEKFETAEIEEGLERYRSRFRGKVADDDF